MAAMRPLEHIFLDPHVAETVQLALTAPHGAIVVGGPVGSGKSATLYSMVNNRKAARPDNNLVTVEDPVEFLFPGITQVQINELTGMRIAEANGVSAPESAKANRNSGVMLQRSGRLDDAMMHYRRALEILPDYASAAVGIGDVYRLKGIDAGALHWYEEALRRDPRMVNAHLEIALLHHRRHEYDAAEAAVLAGLELEPTNPMLLVCLSAVQFSQGDEWRSRVTLVQLDGIRTLDLEDTEKIAAARGAIEAVLQ